jgi:hypothetical protein
MGTPLEIISIAKYTSLRETAIKAFIEVNSLDSKRILNHVAKDGISNKKELIIAITSETGSLEQRNFIESFQIKPPQDGN